MLSHRIRQAAAAAAPALMLVPGVHGEAQARTVRWPASADPNTMVLQQIHAPLVTRNPDLTLHPGVRFHAGRPGGLTP